MSLARAGPDQPGEPLGAAAAGDDAQQELGLTEAGRDRCDAEVACQRQLAAAAEGEAVDRSDRRPRDGGDAVQGAEERVADHPGLRWSAELRDVGARREHALGPGDDDRARRLGDQRLGGSLELAEQLGGEGVDLAVVEPDDGHAVVAALGDDEQRGCGRTRADLPSRTIRAGRRWPTRDRSGGRGRRSLRAAKRSSPSTAPTRSSSRAIRMDRSSALHPLGAAALELARTFEVGAVAPARRRRPRRRPPPVVDTARTIGGVHPRSRPRARPRTPARSRSVSSAPGRSALLSTNTSAISSRPALAACTASPQPGLITTIVVSAAPATSTSTWPTPTVSTTIHGKPAASSTRTASGTASARPPRWPRVAMDRM